VYFGKISIQTTSYNGLAGVAHREDLYRMRVFDEGLARWAEPERRASAQQRSAKDLAVATVFRRRQLGQDNLFDADALARDLDWELVLC
jgi:hypothetical protein